MTQKQRFAIIENLILEYTEEHSETAEKARAALIREGIYTKTGRLKKKYDERQDIDQAIA